MIVLTNLEELKKYFEVRMEMAQNQMKEAQYPETANQAKGMVFAFGEAVKAVESMLKDKSK